MFVYHGLINSPVPEDVFAARQLRAFAQPIGVYLAQGFCIPALELRRSPLMFFAVGDTI